jgi:NADH:ubiquinone reductase (H+-translocating)
MTDPPHVIVVGAGFAGLATVRKLRKAGLRVTMLDKNLYSTFQPLLYQVATGGLNPGDVSYPVGGATGRWGARYLRGELAAVDQVAQRAKLSDGRELDYDYLILATGVSANYFGTPGAAENTFGLYTRVNAIVLRDHIMNGFEQLSADPDDNREFAVTVVGGGATGVELAGTLGELRGNVLRSTFPDVNPDRLRVHLVEMASQLLMPFHPKLREYTRRQLVKRGVDIRLDTKILEVRPDSVVLGSGESLPSDLTVWAAGVAGPDALAAWGLPRGRAGRVLILPDLRVEGSDRIFAIGDISLCEQDPAPQLAQPALQQGRHAAEQVVHLVRGEPTQPFRYHDKGMMATIGRRSAVVQLPVGVRFTGTVAWLAWLGLHLIYLLGGRNRITTLINLSWRYLAWGHGESVIVGDEPPEPLPSQKQIGGASAPKAIPAEKAAGKAVPTGKATANPE